MKTLIIAISLLSTIILTSCPGVVETPVPAGSAWTARTLPVSAPWTALAYGNGTFVAISRYSDDVLSSADGISWTLGTLPRYYPDQPDFWESVTYGNGVFVAVAYASAISATSLDGITWTKHSLGSTFGGWNSVTYGNGVFVANNNNSAAPGSVTSTDGMDWGNFSPLVNEQGIRVVPNNLIAYGDGKFVALPLNLAFSRTSTDGKIWEIHNGLAADWQSITYGNGMFVAVASGGDIAATSPDGETWTARTLPSSADWRSVIYGKGTFVAVASGGTGTEAATSPDGITWTPHTLPSSAGWDAVTYGNGVFAAIAYDGLGTTTAATSP